MRVIAVIDLPEAVPVTAVVVANRSIRLQIVDVAPDRCAADRPVAAAQPVRGPPKVALPGGAETDVPLDVGKRVPPGEGGGICGRAADRVIECPTTSEPA